MTRLSAVIMAHPRRSGFVPELQAKLDRDIGVVWDEKNSRWDTGRRAMASYDPAASHHLVLQDDAVIPHDLLAGLEKAIAHTPPNAALCLYLGRARPAQGAIRRLLGQCTDDTAWIVLPQLHWGVGIVMPTHLIETMLKWADRRNDIANYDLRIGRWLQRYRIPVYYPWPSLVDHRDSPSLVPGRTGQGRHAHRFIGADTSALEHAYDGSELHSLPLSLRKHYRSDGPLA